MLFEELSELVETEHAAIEFALKRKLLPEKHDICPVCHIGNVSWYKRTHEGLKIPYVLRCSRKQCKKKWSVTKNTWFFGSHLTVRQSILLIYCWVKGETIGETSEILQLSKTTVMDYFQFCREVCYTIVSNRTRPIGGPNEIVSLCGFQIERVIDKQKTVVNFLEGVNERTDECFLIEVHSKEPSTLVYLIKTFVLPGSNVIVDNLSSYSKIMEYKSEFDELNIKFVEQTNNLNNLSSPKKCLWKSGKKFLEDEDSKNKCFLLFQYLYFHPIESLSLGEKFERFLGDVARVYPGPFKIPMTPIIY